MALDQQLVVLDSRDQPAASCAVCGNDIPAGEGVTARFQDRTLRFKCPGCYARFQGDPERYLAGQQQTCCDGEHHYSPASEWQCD